MLLGDDGVDGVLVLHAPTALADPRRPAEAVVATIRARAAAPAHANVLTAWLGGRLVEPARRLFADARVPAYETPEDAVHGFLNRARYARTRALAGAIAGARLEIFDGGHAFLLQDPAAWRVAGDFLLAED